MSAVVGAVFGALNSILRRLLGPAHRWRARSLGGFCQTMTIRGC
jgi:hypothetical protein